MKVTTAGAHAGFEPIPGYVLREKIGSGGYGDVWLADAPGGLKKAIKFVHGNVDDDRASHELRSLQRIRQVNHPFILSLERIEVINGQLIIVTELAQGTLLDRFTEFRQRGFVGIPRERLIAYLRDAADGLDFLCQQHDLQHLDVKPGNLLLIADRVKVADFGLIKDVQSKSLSIMGGLTPTYAAPEMFDGRPGRFSDQYSLAIVYQELLTGTLPFRGRTTAQLANEHLNKAPNLESIPLNERPILSKALSKKPQVRFGDCREFVMALERAQRDVELPANKSKTNLNLKVRSAELNFGGEREKPSGRSDSFEQRKSVPRDSGIKTATSSDINRSVKVLPYPNAVQFQDALGSRVPTSDAFDEAESPTQRKTLLVGLGETGAQTLLAARQQLAGPGGVYAESPHLRWLLLDSDQSTINMAIDASRTDPLPRNAVQLMHLKPPTYYRQHQSAQFPQLSRRWVYNIPRSLKTEGVRPLGMLAFLDHAHACYMSIGQTMVELLGDSDSTDIPGPIAVYVIVSAHGGTGGAIANEIGFLIRQVAAELDIEVETELVVTCAAPLPGHSSGMEVGSAMACLTEIHHYFNTGGLHPAIENLPPSKAVDQPPFDFVNLVYGGQFGLRRDWERVIHQCADYLATTIDAPLQDRIKRVRQYNQHVWKDVPDRDWTDWLGTFQVRNIQLHTELDPMTTGDRNCLWCVQQWIDLLESNDAVVPSHDRQGLGDAKKQERVDFAVSDLFRTNKWTAQAWVLRCMNTLLPQGVTKEPSTSPAESPLAGIPSDSLDLTHDQRVDIEHICDLLALDSDHGFHSVAELLFQERSLLMEWFARTWLRETSGWEGMQELFDCLINKFTINANSLNTVATKLGERHDVLLGSVYDGDQSATIEQDNELHTIALETRFHSMASRILTRLASHIHHLRVLWTNDSILLRNELLSLRAELATRLDISIEGDRLPQEFCDSMSNQHAGNSVGHFVRKAMIDIALQRIAKCWGIDAQWIELESWISESDSPLNELSSAVEAYCQKHQSSRRSGTSADMLAVGDDSDLPSTQSFANRSELSTTHQGSGGDGLGQNSSERTQTRSTGILVGNDSENDRPIRNDLMTEIDRARPYLAEFGGGIRNFLLLPRVEDSQLETLYLSQANQRSAVVINCPSAHETKIVAIGEQLALPDLIDRLWTPTEDLWHLAERLLSRVDIDWLAIH